MSTVIDKITALTHNTYMFIFRKIWEFFLDIAQTLLLAASVFLVVYVFLFRPFQVSGHSMDPTFNDGEYVLTNLIALKLEDLKRGDVVVFKAPNEEEKDFIKRVIGLPGDAVLLENGNFYINGELLDESAYLSSTVRTQGQSFLREGQPVTVPPEEYFVSGDNRPYSSDSRDFGFVKKSLMIGKSLFVYWPPTKMRLVENPFTQ